MNIKELRVGDTIEIAYGLHALSEYHVVTTIGKKTVQAISAFDYHAGRRGCHQLRYLSRHNISRNVSAEFRNMTDL